LFEMEKKQEFISQNWCKSSFNLKDADISFLGDGESGLKFIKKFQTIFSLMNRQKNQNPNTKSNLKESQLDLIMYFNKRN